MLDRKAILARCDEHHDEINGAVYKILEQLLDEYEAGLLPKGTNVVLEFLDRLIASDLPYVATSKSLDRGGDCAEVPRVVWYIFFGDTPPCDEIGSFTQAQFNNRAGIHFTDHAAARELDLKYFKFGSRNPDVDHTGIMGRGTFMHTTQVKGTDHDLRYDKLTYGNSKFVCYIRFITDEMLQSVIVGGTPAESEVNNVINKKSSRSDIKWWQQQLTAAGFRGGMIASYFGLWGSKTEAATKAFQRAYGMKQTGYADAATLTKMAEVLAPPQNGDLQEQIAKLKSELAERVAKIADAIKVLNR